MRCIGHSRLPFDLHQLGRFAVMAPRRTWKPKPTVVRLTTHVVVMNRDATHHRDRWFPGNDNATVRHLERAKGRGSVRSSIDLNLLLSLEALLNERSVTRAAEVMAVGQPAMSASRARLRRHYRDPLLVREGRTYALTPLAESLLDPTRSAVAAVATVLERAPHFEPATDRRTFTVVASDYMLVVLLSRAITTLTTEAPGIQMSVLPIGQESTDLLRRQRVDLVIAPAEVVPHDQPFATAPLLTDQYALVADQ